MIGGDYFKNAQCESYSFPHPCVKTSKSPCFPWSTAENANNYTYCQLVKFIMSMFQNRDNEKKSYSLSIPNRSLG